MESKLEFVLYYDGYRPIDNILETIEKIQKTHPYAEIRVEVNRPNAG